jgi:hypothetical protein
MNELVAIAHTENDPTLLLNGHEKEWTAKVPCVSCSYLQRGDSIIGSSHSDKGGINPKFTVSFP